MERLTKRMERTYIACGNLIVARCENCQDRKPSCYEEDCQAELDVIQKLASLEDLEEDGRLIKLPCKPGDEIWTVEEETIRQGRGRKPRVKININKLIIDHIIIGNAGIPMIAAQYPMRFKAYKLIDGTRIGGPDAEAYLTKKEAEEECVRLKREGDKS